MRRVDPEKLRLIPGQSVQGFFSRSSGGPEEVGFFVRSATRLDQGGVEPRILQRAGLIKHNDLFLVLTMLKVEVPEVEVFDLWWNYYEKSGPELFKMMAEQDTLAVHFFATDGKNRVVDVPNGFQRFFLTLPEFFDRAQAWTEVEFDRAVRGFCAQSYPKENLWDMIHTKMEIPETQEEKALGIDDYPGVIPDRLRPFYDYLPEQGHCIKIIPSMFEDKAIDGDPSSFLHPAPVKTVLRCGIRWAKGYPVAPIPFIPGHGLAVPPDDTEF